MSRVADDPIRSAPPRVEPVLLPPPPAAGSDTEAMRCLFDLSEDLKSTLELDAVLSKVAAGMKSYVDYHAFGVLLLDPLGQELLPRYTVGYRSEVSSHWRFGLGQGIVGTAARTREPVLVDDVRADPRYIDAVEGARSELAIPLIVKNRTIGVLDVYHREPGYFTEGHRRLLIFLAGHLANAIENARLYESLRDQARTFSLMHEVSRELTSLLDREELLGRVAQLVKRIIDYQMFAVMLWNEETQLLEHAYSLRFDERFVLKGGFPLGHGIVGTVAALRQPIRVPNVHLDPRYVRCGHDVDVKSEMVVPLVFKDQLIGVLDLESVEYNAFSEQHEQTLATLATYIAIALENARLYGRVLEGERRLAHDLSTARKIQKRLLPDLAPCTPGLDVGSAYAPALQLGGDLYDFLPYGDGRLAVAVGDVAGKATAAALYGSLAIGLLRGLVVQDPGEPAAMLRRMNRYLYQLRLDNRFLAMAFSVYDAWSRTLTLASAGFPPPRLVRDGEVSEIGVGGSPLGLFPDSSYGQEAIPVREGDVIVFCSDGIHECVDPQGGEFGRERLEPFLREAAARPAAEIASGILAATDRHVRPGRAPHDDRTVVVLKVTR